MFGRHPKVGRPSVKHHLKLLWGCSYGDGAIVLRLWWEGRENELCVWLHLLGGGGGGGE